MADADVPKKWKLYTIINGFWLSGKPVFASNKFFAEKLGCSERNIQTCLLQLEGLNLIERIGVSQNRTIVPKGTKLGFVGDEAGLRAGDEAGLHHISDSISDSNKDDFESKSSPPSEGITSNTRKTLDSSQEITRVPQDELFGGPREVPVKAAPAPRDSAQNKLYWKVQGRFSDMCHSAFGARPVRDLKAFKAISFAMNRGGLSEKQIYSLFDDWFDQRKPDEQLMSISAALSSNNINKFKLNN